MTAVVEVKKVSEMKGNFVEVFVTDYIAKKRLFNNNEIAGWLLEEKDGVTEIYHLYRGNSNAENTEINEPHIYVDEKFEGKEKQDQLWNMTKEVKLQHHTRENDDILAKVKPFIY